MYEINFYHQLYRGYVQQSGNNLFKHEKVFQTIDVVLPTEQSIKYFTFTFQGFCLNFNSTFTIFKVYEHELLLERI